jgi:hypothetical protein
MTIIIRAAILSGDPLEFEKLPCHTQAVERCVKLVTEASAAVCVTAARDGFIRVRNEARKKYQNVKPETIFLFKSLSVTCELRVRELSSECQYALGNV